MHSITVQPSAKKAPAQATAGGVGYVTGGGGGDSTAQLGGSFVLHEMGYDNNNFTRRADLSLYAE